MVVQGNFGKKKFSQNYFFNPESPFFRSTNLLNSEKSTRKLRLDFLFFESRTFSVFIFLEGAPFEDLASSLPGFLFVFADFDEGGVLLVDPLGADFDGLLSAGSSLGPSFSLGASTGDEPVSSLPCTS